MSSSSNLYASSSSSSTTLLSSVMDVDATSDILAQREQARLVRLCDDNSVARISHITFEATEKLTTSGEGFYTIEKISKGNLPGHGDVRVRTIRLGQAPEDERMRSLDQYIDKKTKTWLRSVRNAKNIHPLLRFIGLYQSGSEPTITVVSEWPSHGNIMEYLKEQPATIDKMPFVLDIARGLEYLHQSGSGIIHGDIRGENILIRQDGTCCLGELAFESKPSEDTLIQYANWIAPELVDVELMYRRIVDGYRRHEYQGEFKKESDVFALACTVIEIYTGAPAEVQRIPPDVLTLKGVVALERPRSHAETTMIPDDLWWLLNLMLRYSPTKRLDVVQLCQQFRDPQVRGFVNPGHSPLPATAKFQAIRMARQMWSR